MSDILKYQILEYYVIIFMAVFFFHSAFLSVAWPLIVEKLSALQNFNYVKSVMYNKNS